ncbi:MAG: ankyrin repeat domain-containing protein, partial [Oxalobacteraceae bacterium]|nr:ankyrin repeat domain-containing protein [Oxalobacteraceae bacterium]
MSSAPAAGTAASIPVQPTVQPPIPELVAQPAARPQLRNTVSIQDPRGTKRGRDEGDAGDHEPSSEPVVKQARIEPSPAPENPTQALFEAIDAGDTAKLQTLLRQSPALRDTLDSQAPGDTPLCRAARRGKVDIVNLLIQMGAPVDARARNGSTPLMFAAQAGQLEVIDRLCLSGALDACKRLASRNANLTAKNGQGDTCLIWAAFRGYTAVVNWLLDQGVAIDEPNNLGNTALMVACMTGHLEVVQLLANRNANLTAKNGQGDTCLILAASEGRPAVVNWLLDQGVAIDE